MGNGRLMNTIKQNRVLSNLTQEELAAKTKVTRQTIIAMEKGNYAPSVMLALRLAKALSCKVEELFYEEA
jgi:DNA-binding XRE family transcriptional regulator